MTLAVVAPLSAPQAGAQAVVVPVLTSDQLTPGVAPSFTTVAFRVTAVPPETMVAIGLMIVTVSDFEWPPEQPARDTAATARLKNKRNGLMCKIFSAKFFRVGSGVPGRIGGQTASL